RPFREQDDGAAIQEAVKNRLESFCTATLAVYGHGAPPAQDPAKDWHGEQVVPGEIVYFPRHAGTDQERIEEAGVGRSQDDRPGQGNAFAIEHPPSKKNGKYQPEAAPTEIIEGSHRAGTVGFAAQELSCLTPVPPLHPLRRRDSAASRMERGPGGEV